jgi:hypothetical protein
MTKISNQYSLTNILTADLANSRLGINNVSPTVALDVTGAGKFSGVLTLGSTISNGTYTYTLPSATGTLALTSAISGTTNYIAKFTSSTAIGASQIFDNGTNVGIGTSTVPIKFTIATTNNRLELDEANSTTGYLEVLNTGRTASNYLSIYNRGLNVFTRSGGSGSSYVQTLTLADTGAATFSSSVGVGGAPTGTYGTLSVFGGLSIKNDNNAKLEIGRYSSGIQNSYIKIGSNSNSLRITNSTDVADVFIFNNNGSSIQNGINVQLTKTGGSSIVFTLTLGSIGAWTPGYATIRVSGTRSGLQEHYAAMYFLKLVYFQGSGVTSVNNVSGDTGSASIGVTTAFTSGNTIMTITITDVGTSTDYMIADIDASFQTGIGSIT